STLADGLVRVVRAQDRTVAVLAVDPSSPFTGGAVLGDRVRMSRHTLDSGVFIRSMGARGHLGGLAPATREAIHLLDASGRGLVQDALALARKPGWQPPVILTSAAREDGLDRLWEAIRKHRDHLAESGELRSRRLRRVKQEIVALVAERARKEAESVLEGDSA